MVQQPEEMMMAGPQKEAQHMEWPRESDVEASWWGAMQHMVPPLSAEARQAVEEKMKDIDQRSKDQFLNAYPRPVEKIEHRLARCRTWRLRLGSWLAGQLGLALASDAGTTGTTACSTDGWVYVPHEPTPDMMRAAWAAIPAGAGVAAWDVWTAMIAAAPEMDA